MFTLPPAFGGGGSGFPIDGITMLSGDFSSPVDGNWRVRADQYEYNIERFEFGSWVSKSTIQDSIHTDIYYTENKVGGLLSNYTQRQFDDAGVELEGITTRFTMLTSDAFDERSSNLGDLKGGLHFLGIKNPVVAKPSDHEDARNFYEPYDPVVDQDAAWVANPRVIKYPLIDDRSKAGALYYSSESMSIQQWIGVDIKTEYEGNPIRAWLQDWDGNVFAESDSIYNWGQEGYDKFLSKGPTEYLRIEFPVPLILPNDQDVLFYVQTRDGVPLGLHYNIWEDPLVYDNYLEHLDANWHTLDLKTYALASREKTVFITNVYSANPSPEDVMTLERENTPNEESVKSVDTTVQNLTIEVEWDRIGEYEGLPTVRTSSGDAIPVTKTGKIGGCTYTGIVTMPIESEIVARYAEHNTKVPVTRGEPIIMDNIYWMPPYPGSQTEAKSGDIMNVRVETSGGPVNQIEVVSTGGSAVVGELIPVTPTSDGVFDIQVMVDADGITSRTVGFVGGRAKGVSGAWSAVNYGTIPGGVIPETELSLWIWINNLYPSIDYSIVYPAGQLAIKDSEKATLTTTISNKDTFTISAANSDLNVVNVEGQQLVSRTGSGLEYNVSIPNVTTTANRSANDATTVKTTVVSIANIAAELYLGHAGTMQSGGNDGTIAPTYTIAGTSNQLLLSAPTITAETNSFTTNGFTSFLSLSDDLARGTYDFYASYTNLAGIVSTNITSGGTYTLSGFVLRSIPLPPQEREVTINVNIESISDLSVVWDKYPNSPLSHSNFNADQSFETEVGTYFLDNRSFSLNERGKWESNSVDTNILIEEV